MQALAYIIAVFAALLDPLVGTLFALPHLRLFQAREGRWNTPRRRARGLAVLLGGIEGPSLAQHAVAGGLIRGGWRGAIVIHHWNTGPPLLRALPNLRSRRRHERAANELLQILETYTRQQPGRPVCIVAVSGGCWIAARTLERLQPETPIQRCVLLAPAISAAADLSAAAARCQRGMILVRSRMDFVMLGLCTTVFGTSDGRHGPAAGLCALRRPPPNLRELCWQPAWARYGYLGSHCTAVAPAFIQAEIAPLLVPTGPEPCAKSGPAR